MGNIIWQLATSLWNAADIRKAPQELYGMCTPGAFLTLKPHPPCRPSLASSAQPIARTFVPNPLDRVRLNERWT